MTLWQRSTYAFFSMVLIAGIASLSSLLLMQVIPEFDFLETIFSNYFAVTVYIVSWLVAPYTKRFIPLSRW